MDQIIVVSRRKGGTKAPPGYSIVRVDRTSPLGNPFVMRNEAERDSVCDRYHQHFAHSLVHSVFMDELRERVQRGEKLALECWCAPKRCHADTIKLELMRFAR